MTLAQVQFDLKAPKSQYNNFGHYAYRSTEDILQAVKPILKQYGDTLIISDEPLMVGDWHYIKATVTFTDKDNKQTVAYGYAREADQKKGLDPSQITGTASSYARKYALNGLFLIDDTKDADTDEYRQQTRQKASQSSKKQTSQPAKKQANAEFAKAKKEYTHLIEQLEDATKQNAEAVSQIAKQRLAGAQPDFRKKSPLEQMVAMNAILQQMLKEAGAAEQQSFIEV